MKIGGLYLCYKTGVRDGGMQDVVDVDGQHLEKAVRSCRRDSVRGICY